MQPRSAVFTQALHMAMGSIPTGGIGFVRGASATGTRARVARVRAEYPNQLDYSGAECNLTQILSRRMCSTSYHFRRVLRDGWGHVRKRR